jgi:hypothetical protein
MSIVGHYWRGGRSLQAFFQEACLQANKLPERSDVPVEEASLRKQVSKLSPDMAGDLSSLLSALGTSDPAHKDSRTLRGTTPGEMTNWLASQLVYIPAYLQASLLTNKLASSPVERRPQPPICRHRWLRAKPPVFTREVRNRRCRVGRGGAPRPGVGSASFALRSTSSGARCTRRFAVHAVDLGTLA